MPSCPKELMEKGVLYLRLTQLDLAIPLLEQAFQTALFQKNFKLALQTQIYLLRVWAEKENFFAISKLKVEIIEFALKNNISLESPFYYTIGICSFYQNNFAEAKLYFETAHLKAQSETPIHQAHAELGLAIIKTESGELSSAIGHIQRAKHISHHLASTTFSLSSSSPSPDLKIMILLNEGKILRCQKNYNKALELFQSALEIDKYHKNLFAYLYLLYEISLTYFSLNNFPFARLYLDLALNSCPEKELIRLEKLLKELKLKLADHDYDFLIHKTERKIVDRVRGEISFNRQELILDILLHLIENQGQAFSKEALCTRFWSERYKPETHDNKIYVTIKRLRNTIEDNLKKPRYILHSREGYYFNQTIKVAIQA